MARGVQAAELTQPAACPSVGEGDHATVVRLSPQVTALPQL